MMVAGCGAKFNAEPTGSGGSGNVSTATTSVGGAGGVATGGGGSTGSEGGAGGQTPQMFTPCGVADDFDDNTLADIWDPYGNVTETDQRIRVALSTNAVGYHALFPTQPLVVRDCAMWIEMRGVGTTGSHGDAYFQVLRDNDTTVNISVFDGFIFFTEEQNGAWVFEVGTPYDPVAHRWWMIREESGTVHYATSPDGRSWTERATRTTPSYFDSADFQIGGCTWNPVAAPGGIELDNLNIPPP